MDQEPQSLFSDTFMSAVKGAMAGGFLFALTAVFSHHNAVESFDPIRSKDDPRAAELVTSCAKDNTSQQEDCVEKGINRLNRENWEQGLQKPSNTLTALLTFAAVGAGIGGIARVGRYYLDKACDAQSPSPDK